ncbi:hypothetical protein Sru01_30160 [Sphaerisporangium rufum]|uniref:Uncharacterized protein n=1 Tax=Sphaerisporangium rufum TaxID=1381558 RepID=A0A919R1S3_9ACTN|nr:hypothetical protein Sru01_30160 [Sphaerisporangium rufum]
MDGRGGSAGSRATAPTTASNATASARYRVASPTIGISAPASSGPRIAPVYRVSELRLAAAGTRPGTTAPIVVMIGGWYWWSHLFNYREFSMPWAAVVTFRDSGGNRSTLEQPVRARRGEVGPSMSVGPAKIAT